MYINTQVLTTLQCLPNLSWGSEMLTGWTNQWKLCIDHWKKNDCNFSI